MKEEIFFLLHFFIFMSCRVSQKNMRKKLMYLILMVDLKYISSVEVFFPQTTIEMNGRQMFLLMVIEK
jgi:hypothetical protein